MPLCWFCHEAAHMSHVTRKTVFGGPRLGETQTGQFSFILFGAWCSTHSFLLVLLHSITILQIEILPQDLKNITLPRILQCKFFWREVACVPAFLNVIDTMTDTSLISVFAVRLMGRCPHSHFVGFVISRLTCICPGLSTYPLCT